jgi:outer membrane protein insertion porin family
LSVTGYLIDTLGDRERFGSAILGSGDDDHNPLTPSENDDGDPTTADPLLGTARQWTINAWTARVGYAVDTRNNYLLPTRGMLNRFQAEVALPGSDLEYYRINYDFEYYRPLNRWLVLKAGLSLGYGNAYGKTADAACYERDDITWAIDPASKTSCGLPFFKNFYAGGPGSVRGYTANTLGPTISYGSNSRVQPLGGPVKTTGTFEFYFPQLLGGAGTRISAFLDYGYVFARPSDFGFNRFRVSTGLALQWQSPVGPISISYAIPFDVGHDDGTPDEIERLQFTFGNQQ